MKRNSKGKLQTNGDGSNLAFWVEHKQDYVNGMVLKICYWSVCKREIVLRISFLPS